MGERDWEALDRELGAWAATGAPATFWWRDDDAERPSSELDRLLDLSGADGVPVTLAVIPRDVDEALPRRLEASSQAAVVQHGYAHLNHAGPGERASEFASGRTLDGMLAELASGRETLERMFGARFRPLFVPPWNRVAPALVPALPRAGLTALSTFTPRPRAEPAPGIRQTNCHVDLIRWREGRRFAGEAHALQGLVEHLAARRERRVDAEEPTGVLTHHRVHDEAGWTFLARLFDRTRAHRSVRWLDCSEAVWGTG